MGEQALRRALRDISTINAFFAVDVEPPGEGWLALEGLWNRPELLEARVSDVRARLAARAGRSATEVEWRVAASITYQGLASRLLSPMIGAALLHSRIPDPATLRWRPAQGVLPLALGAGPGIAVPEDTHRSEAIATLIHQWVFQGVLAPLGTALRTRVKVAPGLLWGNVASSLAGTLVALQSTRPAVAAETVMLGELLLGRQPLAGLGEFTNDTEGGAFVRATCCLYYRIPGCAKCGDCALAPREG